MNEKYHITPDLAPKARDWIANRGGIARWKSINLSNPNASWSTPATIEFARLENQDRSLVSPICPTCKTPIRQEKKISPNIFLTYCTVCGIDHPQGSCLVAYPKPNWQCANEPEVLTSEDDVVVDIPKLYKIFKVSLQRKGFSVVLTDASTAKVKRLIAECAEKHGKDSWHEFDYETQQCSVLFADKQIPLKDWKPE